MRSLVVRAFCGILLIGVALGVGAVSAQSAPSVALRTISGTVVGSASDTISNGSMNVTVTLQGAAPLASYTVCVSSPYPGSSYGQCPFGVGGYTSGFVNGCISFSYLGCSTGQTAVIYTDANGNGQAVVPVAGVLPTAVVTVSNNYNPSDASQATLVSNGGTQTPCIGSC